MAIRGNTLFLVMAVTIGVVGLTSMDALIIAVVLVAVVLGLALLGRASDWVSEKKRPAFPVGLVLIAIFVFVIVQTVRDNPVFDNPALLIVMSLLGFVTFAALQSKSTE